MTIENVLKVVRQFYGDTTRSREQTLDDLERLIEEIEMMIDGLKSTSTCDE